jgi:IPT/TIG domain-containing protein
MVQPILSDRVHTCMIRIAILSLLLISTTGLFASDDPPPSGVELAIPNETVPPGGMLQLKVQITEPKPISKGGQKTRFAGRMLGAPLGIALFSPSGDASGTAIVSKGAVQFSLWSSLIDMGNNVDYPIVTIAMPVKATAKEFQTADLTLDSSFSDWQDPNGKNYVVSLTNGTLTVGGTVSISNIVPGGGLLPAGTKIAIQGIGFQPNSKIQIDETKFINQTYVSPNEIDITLSKATNMTSRRVRVTDQSTNETVTYYSYARTVATGRSTHALIAATVPLFSQSTWTLGYLDPVVSGSQYTGLAVQNPTSTAANVTLQLLSTNGSVLKTKVINLAAYHRISRDLTEFFVGAVPSNGNAVKVTSSVPVQVLGLLVDDTLGTVDPINPTAKP